MTRYTVHRLSPADGWRPLEDLGAHATRAAAEAAARGWGAARRGRGAYAIPTRVEKTKDDETPEEVDYSFCIE